jgi:hypothetical protein
MTVKEFWAQKNFTSHSYFFIFRYLKAFARRCMLKFLINFFEFLLNILEDLLILHNFTPWVCEIFNI